MIKMTKILVIAVGGSILIISIFYLLTMLDPPVTGPMRFLAPIIGIYIGVCLIVGFILQFRK